MSALLPATLEIAVPLALADLQAAGGPAAEDWVQARRLVDELGTHGDEFLFRGTTGRAGELFAQLARAIAVLSYAPGGVTVLGSHWESSAEEQHSECRATDD